MNSCYILDEEVVTLAQFLQQHSDFFSFWFMQAENRKLFHEQEVEKCLVALLGSENDGTKIAASQAISVMCENSGSKEFFNNQGKQTRQTHF